MRTPICTACHKQTRQTKWCVQSRFQSNIWRDNFFTKKDVDAPREPMISHLYPWASTSVLGGTRWCYRASPLPDVCGGALGEASGTVYFHLREQGRPQGTSFSAGDLSLHSRHSSPTQFGNRVSFDETADARMLRQRSNGRDAGAYRDARAEIGRAHV